VNGLVNVLEAARQYKCALFFPSSIGAFGPDTPRKRTPQVTIQRPTTMYGVTKVVGEMLCEDYHRRFGMDTRGLRFPGLISYQTEPGGGTTDYAVDIFRQALQHAMYTCYLRADTRLPMMYMPDAIRAMIELMEAEPARLIQRNAYNLGALDFTRYCVAAGHGTSKLVANNAYGWQCTSPAAAADTTAACNLLYHVTGAVSRFAVFSSPGSWQCWN